MTINIRRFKLKDFKSFNRMLHDKVSDSIIHQEYLNQGLFTTFTAFLYFRENALAICKDDLFIGLMIFERCFNLDGVFVSVVIFPEHQGLGYFPEALKIYIAKNPKVKIYGNFINEHSRKAFVKTGFTKFDNILVWRTS